MGKQYRIRHKITGMYWSNKEDCWVESGKGEVVYSAYDKKQHDLLIEDGEWDIYERYNVHQ